MRPWGYAFPTLSPCLCNPLLYSLAYCIVDLPVSLWILRFVGTAIQQTNIETELNKLINNPNWCEANQSVGYWQTVAVELHSTKPVDITKAIRQSAVEF